MHGARANLHVLPAILAPFAPPRPR